MSKLSDRHMLFVAEYMRAQRPAEAAIRAGYSAKTAAVAGSKLLQRPDIREAIAKAQAALSIRTNITAERTLLEIGRLAFSDIRRLFDADGRLRPVTDLDDDIAAAVAAVEVVTRPGAVDEDGNRTVDHVHKIKMCDKIAALDKLARHLGILIDRAEVNVTHRFAEMTDEQIEAEIARIEESTVRLN